MKQLLVDSIFCFSFDRPVTVNCPILVLKKKSYGTLTDMFKLTDIQVAAVR